MGTKGRIIVGLIALHFYSLVNASGLPEEWPEMINDRAATEEDTEVVLLPDFAENLLMNSGFEEGRTNWVLAKYSGARAFFYLDTMNAISGRQSASVNVLSSAGSAEDVLLFQRLPVRKLTEYYITFTASVTKEIRISVSILNDINTLWSREVTLHPGCHNYGPFRYFNSTSDAFTMLSFEMGGTSGIVTLDSVFVNQDSTVLAFEKINRQPGLSVDFKSEVMAHVQLPIAHNEDIPLIVTDSLDNLIAAATFPAGATFIELILDKKWTGREELIFTVFLSDKLLALRSYSIQRGSGLVN